MRGGDREREEGWVVSLALEIQQEDQTRGDRTTTITLPILRNESINQNPLQQRSMVSQSCHDERLGGAAREAKERLDERLRAPWKSEPKRLRRGVAPSVSVEERRKLVVGDLQTEVFGLKKSGSKRFNWAKMSWKASDQNECAVCLDHFKVGETLAHLPCAHRFHSRCLVPWLENNAHCPCCRMILAPN